MLREEAVIVFDGNWSQLEAAGDSDEALDFQVSDRLSFAARVRHASNGMRTISECVAKYDETVSPLRNYNAPFSALVYFAGDHDLTDNTTAQEAYQSLTDYVALAHQQGWKVVVVSRSSDSRPASVTQSEGRRYCSLLSDNEAQADTVLDLDLDQHAESLLEAYVSANASATAVAQTESVISAVDPVATALDRLRRTEPVRETLVLFGEVQILAIYRHLLDVLHEARSERFSLEFVDSNDDRAVEVATRLLGDSGKLILQVNPERPFLHEGVLKMISGVKSRAIFNVPMLLCRSLWPSDRFDENLEATSSSPVKGTRGDDSLRELVQQSTSSDLAVSEYLATDLSEKLDLTGLFQADLHAWQSVESLSDLKFRQLFADQFSLKKLFNSFKLPSNFSIKVLVAAIGDFIDLKATEIAISNRRLSGPEILQPDTPIHPSIARHFDLQWLKKKPLFDIFGRKFDYPRWAHEYAKIHAARDNSLILANMASPESSFEFDSQANGDAPVAKGHVTSRPGVHSGPTGRESTRAHEAPKRASFWQRAKQTNKLFLFCVALPVTLSTAYYTIFAADVYVSQSSFLVRSPQKNTQSSGLVGALLQGTGIARSTDDTFAVNDYMVSRDALAALNRNNAFEAAYGSGQGDFLSRFGVLPRQRAFEDLLRYFRNRVLVQYDSDTGITTLEVHAFSPADSRKINEQLLELGEHRVNEMNSRAKQDLISYAQQEVERSEVSLQKASAALSAFRDEQAIFDPERQSTLALQNVLQIQEELMASKLQLAQLKSIAPNNPQIPALNVRISTLQNEVDKASSEVTGGRNSLAFKSPAYERLELNRQFADRQLTTALASLETARSDAQRQQLYLDRISQPNLPDKAMLPYRLRNILATIVLGLLVWGTLNLLIASIREHRD